MGKTNELKEPGPIKMEDKTLFREKMFRPGPQYLKNFDVSHVIHVGFRAVRMAIVFRFIAVFFMGSWIVDNFMDQSHCKAQCEE